MQTMSSRTEDLLIERVKRNSHYDQQKSHYHPYYEIGYLFSGTRSMTINHSLYNLQKGDLIFISKSELHKGFPVENHPSSVELINVYFSESYLSPFMNIYGADCLAQLFSCHHIAIPVGRRDYLEDLLQKMLFEYDGIDELSKNLLTNYIHELITFLLRCLKKKLESPKDVSNCDLIQDAVKYIYYNFDKELSLVDVANKYNMSSSYFSKRFKAATGFGYKEYLISVRLKEACNLLLTTNRCITDIAFSCGFNDSNYFGDAFRRSHGVSPNKYRKYKGLL